MPLISTAYAFCVLQIPLPPFPKGEEVATDAQTHLGSGDSIAVWINGEQAHYNSRIRPLVLDEDIFEVSLKAGANRCLVKVSQRINFGFAVWMNLLPSNRAVLSGTITDEMGQPISNAAVRLELSGSPPPNLPRQGGGNIIARGEECSLRSAIPRFQNCS